MPVEIVAAGDSPFLFSDDILRVSYQEDDSVPSFSQVLGDRLLEPQANTATFIGKGVDKPNRLLILRQNALEFTNVDSERSSWTTGVSLDLTPRRIVQDGGTGSLAVAFRAHKAKNCLRFLSQSLEAASASNTHLLKPDEEIFCLCGT